MKIWLDDLRPAPWGYESARSVNEAKALRLQSGDIRTRARRCVPLPRSCGRRRKTASRLRCWISTMIWEILQIKAAMPSNCWTGWWSGRPFTPWRSIPRTPWAERIWRACWRGTGERSTGRKHNTRKRQNKIAEKHKMK